VQLLCLHWWLLKVDASDTQHGDCDNISSRG
jgi:hypothetical protein